MSSSTVRHRGKVQTDPVTEGDKSPSAPSPKVKKSSPNVGVSFSRVLLFGIFQGLIVGMVGGWILGWFLWKDAPEELSSLIAMRPPRKCDPCPVTTCSTPECSPYPLAHQCVSRTSDLFMKADPEVNNYTNKRLDYLFDVLTPAECQVIIRDSGAEELAPGGLLGFPRDESWGWLYKRIHGTVLKQNQEFWHYHIPTDYHSELVEDILLAKYDKDTEFDHEKHWMHEIGPVGRTGKRVLGALIQLNDGYKGGVFSTQVAQEPYAISAASRILWTYPAFLLKNKSKVTEGLQYVLYYRVRRY